MAGKRLTICMPVYNDWESASLVINDLCTRMAGQGYELSVLLVDDGSSQPLTDAVETSQHKDLQSIKIIRLQRNVGNQRAICIGLCHLWESQNADLVVVMDADGEDRPIDVPKLLQALEAGGRKQVVFAKRGNRSEDLVFKWGYSLYKWVHYLLTGFKVEVGNFSALPLSIVGSLVTMSELWNHYAACVVHGKLGVAKIKLDRGQRLRGKSKMNTQKLAIHGLQAISVYADLVGARLATLVAAATTFLVVCCALVLVWQVLFEAKFPILLPLLLYGLGLGLVSGLVVLAFIVLVLSSRERVGFIPIRDYHHFIAQVDTVR